MTYKTQLSSLFGISLFLLACQAPQNKSNAPLLRFQGNGEVEVQANQASVNISLNALHPNFQTARKSLLEEAAKLDKLLDELGVPKSDRTTHTIQVGKEYDWTDRGQVFKGYRHTYNLSVLFKDIAVMEKAYPLLMEHPDWNTGYISYSHSNMDSLEQVAHKLALAKATALAEVMADQAGMKNIRVMQVANIVLANNSNQLRAYSPDDQYTLESAGNREMKSLISIHEGKIKVQRSVNVEFAGE